MTTAIAKASGDEPRPDATRYDNMKNMKTTVGAAVGYHLNPLPLEGCFEWVHRAALDYGALQHFIGTEETEP